MSIGGRARYAQEEFPRIQSAPGVDNFCALPGGRWACGFGFGSSFSRKLAGVGCVDSWALPRLFNLRRRSDLSVNLVVLPTK